MIHFSFTVDDFKRVVWTFLEVAAAALVAGVLAQTSVPKNITDAKQVAIGLVVAAAAAGFSAVKNLILADGSGLK